MIHNNTCADFHVDLLRFNIFFNLKYDCESIRVGTFSWKYVLLFTAIFNLNCNNCNFGYKLIYYMFTILMFEIFLKNI